MKGHIFFNEKEKVGISFWIFKSDFVCLPFKFNSIKCNFSYMHKMQRKIP